MDRWWLRGNYWFNKFEVIPILLSSRATTRDLYGMLRLAGFEHLVSCVIPTGAGDLILRGAVCHRFADFLLIIAADYRFAIDYVLTFVFPSRAATGSHKC
ncbi:MAG: hypothetical protein JWO44_930 [Bacteroidetes bacterium]|nr:hypothetical protein [Bacteroidota bacterium]